MELATNGITWPRTKQIRLFRNHSIKFMLVVSILVTQLGLTVGVVAVTRHEAALPNPFSDYAYLLDGQLEGELVSVAFTCYVTTANSGYLMMSSDSYCVYLPDMGIFERISVMVSNDLRVKWINFEVRGNGLTVGDLALLWGRPPIITTPNEQMTVDWPGAEWNILANTEGRRFSYQKPVYRIKFTAAS